MKIKILKEVTKNLFKKPLTVRFPKESIPISDNYRGEWSFDIDKCIGCGLCYKICPNKAIEMIEIKEKGELKKYPQADMSKCCFCGLCQDICPVKAIKLKNNFPSSTTDPSSLIKNPARNGGKEDERNAMDR